jgi:hypothetical protein
MALTAAETETGKIYRRTRLTHAGHFYKRPRLRVVKLIARILRQGNPLCRDLFLVRMHQDHPDFILLSRYHRGTDPFTDERFEVHAYVLVPPDMVLREVRKPPGYKERLTAKAK